MPANDYHLVSHWRVEGTVAEVADIIGDAGSLPAWWGSVYSELRQIEDGNADGIGKVFAVNGKGWLPYKLHLTFRQTEQRYPLRFTVGVSGDLNGVGVWTFAQDGPDVNVTFDWTVSANKVVLRWLSPLLKPIFTSNHRWTMRRGEDSLRLELARRRATTEEERAAIAPPPPPFKPSPVALAIGAATAVAALGAAAYAVIRGRRKV